MNSTNRALNRLFIFFIGFIILALGAGTAALCLLPDIRQGWKTTAPTVHKTAIGWFTAASIPGTTVSWWTIAIIAFLVIVVIVLVVFVFRQGHGHTSILITDAPTKHGRTIVESAVAEDALTDALSSRPELISAHVRTFQVKGTPVLNIAVTARRGVSPKEVTSTVENALHALDELLGETIPAYLHISGGFRANLAKSTRLQ